MKTKIVAALAVFCFIAVMAVSAEQADAAEGTGYVSQLDANGQSVYAQVIESFATEINSSSPKSELNLFVYFPDPVIFSTEEEAQVYAVNAVNSALAAIYYKDAEAVWLWDLPVTAPEVTVNCGEVQVSIPGSTTSGPASYFMPQSATFKLSVPADVADDPSTAENETIQIIQKLRDARSEVTGDLSQKVQAIADSLRSVRVVDDEEGSVSNAYDALVGRSSSSAGIAAAFTYLCAYNQVNAVTVKGTIVTNSDGDTAAGYWNAVYDGASVWYAADITVYNGEDRSPLLAGTSTLVGLSSGNATRGFGSTHVADLDLASPNSLEPVQVSVKGYDWPDDRGFLEKWGVHVVVVILVAIVAAVMLYAVRTGNI